MSKDKYIALLLEKFNKCKFERSYKTDILTVSKIDEKLIIKTTELDAIVIMLNLLDYKFTDNQLEYLFKEIIKGRQTAYLVRRLSNSNFTRFIDILFNNYNPDIKKQNLLIKFYKSIKQKYYKSFYPIQVLLNRNYKLNDKILDELYNLGYIPIINKKIDITKINNEIVKKAIVKFDLYDNDDSKYLCCLIDLIPSNFFENNTKIMETICKKWLGRYDIIRLLVTEKQAPITKDAIISLLNRLDEIEPICQFILDNANIDYTEILDYKFSHSKSRIIFYIIHKYLEINEENICKINADHILKISDIELIKKCCSKYSVRKNIFLSDNLDDNYSDYHDGIYIKKPQKKDIDNTGYVDISKVDFNNIKNTNPLGVIDWYTLTQFFTPTHKFLNFCIKSHCPLSDTKKLLEHDKVNPNNETLDNCLKYYKNPQLIQQLIINYQLTPSDSAIKYMLLIFDVNTQEILELLIKYCDLKLDDTLVFYMCMYRNFTDLGKLGIKYDSKLYHIMFILDIIDPYIKLFPTDIIEFHENITKIYKYLQQGSKDTYGKVKTLNGYILIKLNRSKYYIHKTLVSSLFNKIDLIIDMYVNNKLYDKYYIHFVDKIYGSLDNYIKILKKEYPVGNWMYIEEDDDAEDIPVDQLEF